MKQNDVITLFERIKNHYNIFVYDDNKVKEWHRFLKDFNNSEVLDNLDKYILEYHDRPPLVFELTRGLEKNTTPEVKEQCIQCDLCKQLVYCYDWSEFDKHYRKCQKIDFIDRQSKAIRGYGITKAIYYNKSDEELDRDYRKVMDNWVEEHPNEAVTPEKFGKGGNMGNLFKKIGDGEE